MNREESRSSDKPPSAVSDARTNGAAADVGFTARRRSGLASMPGQPRKYRTDAARGGRFRKAAVASRQVIHLHPSQMAAASSHIKAHGGRPCAKINARTAGAT